MNPFAVFAVVVFCLLAAGVLTSSMWVFAALAGVAAALAFSAKINL